MSCACANGFDSMMLSGTPCAFHSCALSPEAYITGMFCDSSRALRRDVPSVGTSPQMDVSYKSTVSGHVVAKVCHGLEVR
jgi:hypothetical protein